MPTNPLSRFRPGQGGSSHGSTGNTGIVRSHASKCTKASQAAKEKRLQQKLSTAEAQQQASVTNDNLDQQADVEDAIIPGNATSLSAIFKP